MEKKHCGMKYECISRCMMYEKLIICMHVTTYG